jgi:hypothetical protein
MCNQRLGAKKDDLGCRSGFDDDRRVVVVRLLPERDDVEVKVAVIRALHTATRCQTRH